MKIQEHKKRIALFIVFLLTAENSDNPPSPRPWPGENRLAGVAKILFWATLSLCFWIVAPVFFGLVLALIKTGW